MLKKFKSLFGRINSKTKETKEIKTTEIPAIKETKKEPQETKTTEIQLYKRLTVSESIDLVRSINNYIKKNIREFINYSNSSITSVSVLSNNLDIINKSLDNILNLVISIYDDYDDDYDDYYDNNKDINKYLLIDIIDLFIKIITIINNYFYNNYHTFDNNYIIKGFKLTILLKNLKKIINDPLNNRIKDKLINDKLINDKLIEKNNSLKTLNDLLCLIDSYDCRSFEKSDNYHQSLITIHNYYNDLEKLNNEISRLFKKGGKNKNNYKKTDKKITVIYKKKKYTRVIYICERKKYVKIDKTYMLLSKLKKDII
jgi:hypothetical protein